MLRPRPPKPWIPSGSRPPRVLVVRLSALGDVVHALPVLPVLRRELPGARIDWLVEDRAAALLADRPELDRVVVFPRRELRILRGRPRAWVGRIRAFVADLRRGRYDVSLDLQGNLKSGALARLSGARHRYGLDRRAAREGNHLFSTRRALPPAGARHRVQRNLALLGAMLGRAAAWVDPGLAEAPGASAAARARLEAAGLDAEGGYAVLHPGTSAFGAFKRWPPDRFADLARSIAARGLPVVVTAPPGEVSLARAVCDGADGKACLLDVEGLDVLGEVMRGARVVVAADTGPLHLAALAGTPVVGLFGPKDGAVYGPWGRGRTGVPGPLAVVSRDDVACRPCTLRQCADPVCMTTLEPEAVLAAIDETLRDEDPS